MINYAMINNLQEVREIYEEWTGKDVRVGQLPMNSHVAVAMFKKKVVAVAQTIVVHDSIWDRDWLLVENVYVAKKFRRRGIGSGLMKFIESVFLLPDKCQFLKLTSSKLEGQAMYRILRYEEGLSFKKWAKT